MLLIGTKVDLRDNKETLKKLAAKNIPPITFAQVGMRPKLSRSPPRYCLPRRLPIGTRMPFAAHATSLLRR